jgi:hypothetical protein
MQWNLQEVAEMAEIVSGVAAVMALFLTAAIGWQTIKPVIEKVKIVVRHPIVFEVAFAGIVLGFCSGLYWSAQSLYGDPKVNASAFDRVWMVAFTCSMIVASLFIWAYYTAKRFTRWRTEHGPRNPRVRTVIGRDVTELLDNMRQLNLAGWKQVGEHIHHNEKKGYYWQEMTHEAEPEKTKP